MTEEPPVVRVSTAALLRETAEELAKLQIAPWHVSRIRSAADELDTEKKAVEPSDDVASEYAVIELMGHVRHVGRLTEVERFGTKMGRVDIPKDGKFENGFTTVFFSGASLYRVTPCDLATVMKANRPGEAYGRLTYQEPDDDEPDQLDEDND